MEFPLDIGYDIGGAYDWDIKTVPQTQLNGATRSIPMGRVVGGGSILNGMLWNRGNQGDYNDWASFGNPGWSWNDLLPYFKKVIIALQSSWKHLTNYSPKPTRRSTTKVWSNNQSIMSPLCTVLTAQFRSAIRSTTGINQVSDFFECSCDHS